MFVAIVICSRLNGVTITHNRSKTMTYIMYWTDGSRKETNDFSNYLSCDESLYASMFFEQNWIDGTTPSVYEALDYRGELVSITKVA